MRHRYASALAVLLCLGLAPAASATPGQGPAPPDTPAGRRIQALLKAFEAGSPDAIRAFIAANFSEAALKEAPLDQRTQRLSGMAKQIGPLDFQKMLPGGDDRASFLARAKNSGDWLEVGLQLDPAPPHGIRGLRFEQTEGPDAARETRKGSDAEVAAAADAHLRQLAETGAFSGVVLIAKNGTPFFHKAYGLADRAFGVPNRTDTKFNLGSINKTFTQTAIGQLAEKGRLSLSDTIRKHLPDYPNRGGRQDHDRAAPDDDLGHGRFLRREVRRDAEEPDPDARRTISASSRRIRSSSSPEPAGATRTRATSCSASSSRRSRARPTTTTCARTSTGRPG